MHISQQNPWYPLTTVSEPSKVGVSRLGRGTSWQGRHMSYEAPEIRLLGSLAELTEGSPTDITVPNGSPVLNDKPKTSVTSD